MIFKTKKRPIKPNKIKTYSLYEHDDKFSRLVEFECPVCGIYQEACFTEAFKPEYCAYCGQKLDLGE